MKHIKDWYLQQCDTHLLLLGIGGIWFLPKDIQDLQFMKLDMGFKEKKDIENELKILQSDDFIDTIIGSIRHTERATEFRLVI